MSYGVYTYLKVNVRGCTIAVEFLGFVGGVCSF